MTRDAFTTLGCALVLLVSVTVFLAASVSRTYDMETRNELWVTSFVILAAGIGVILLAQAILTWRDVRSDEAAKQELIARAARLRDARERRRSTRPFEPTRDLTPAEAERELKAAQIVVLDEDMPATMAIPVHVTPKRAAADQGLCPLCQTNVVAGEMYVGCPSCEVPYHADCWEYNRGCAIRGCPARAA